jgi:hypothetical protein
MSLKYQRIMSMELADMVPRAGEVLVFAGRAGAYGKLCCVSKPRGFLVQAGLVKGMLN